MPPKPQHCQDCPTPGQGFVPPTGMMNNGVSLVGMMPAKTEILRGEPFTGRAGSILARILRKVDSRENFDIRNTLQCMGMVDDMCFEGVDLAVAHCSHLREAYNTPPKVKVAMGAVPFYVLTGQGKFAAYTTKNGHTSWKWGGIPITKARGYRFEGLDGVPVIPTLHPSFLGRGNMNLIPLLIWDISRALDERGQAPPSFPLEQLELYPTPERFEEWCQEALESEFLVHDIETAYSRDYDADDDEQDSSFEITRFSLARADARAITAPYQEPFIGILKDFLARARMDRVGWNSDEFDDPREAYNGWPMHGRRIDARWLWHFLQPSLPQSLACVATFYTRVPEWKSFGSSRGTDDELYSSMDSWATARCYQGIVRALKNRRLM